MVGFRTRVGAVMLTTGLVAVGAAAAPASAGSGGGYPGGGYPGGGGGVTVVAEGLDGPFGLAGLGRGFVVAENATGEVTKISKGGDQLVLVSDAAGAAGVASGWGHVFSVLGGPNEEGAPPAGAFAPSSVLRTNLWTHKTKSIADLLDWELKKNPDGQVQFVDGQPVDALSNPFAMTSYWGGLLVADGGANDVIKVNPWTGRRSTFFVPPTVKDVPGCQNANPGTVGCDPVPTGVVVRGGSAYVSTLGAEVPGAGRIYKVNAFNGKVQRIWKGLTSPTGIAVGSDGSLYYSEVLYGMPEGEPGPGFDPASVGRITRIAPNGKTTHAQVTMPTGLLWKDGSLYSTAWSTAFFFGIEHAGQVVKVGRGAFH